MKRMVALLLGIALLLMSVAAADDDLNEIAARVENYLEDMTDDAGTQTLEECLELLKNVGNGPSKKALEIYCKILLNIAKENFDDANQSMYTLTLLKKNFEEEFIEHSAGITSFLTVDELGAYLQGREAEYRGDWDAAMTAYEQCAAKADVLDRMMTIEGKQYDDAIDLIDAGRYDEAHAMLEKLAERNYSYAKQMLRDWATPTPKPTATPTPKPTATPTPKPTATPTPKPTATPTLKPTATPAPKLMAYEDYRMTSAVATYVYSAMSQSARCRVGEMPSCTYLLVLWQEYDSSHRLWSYVQDESGQYSGYVLDAMLTRVSSTPKPTVAIDLQVQFVSNNSLKLTWEYSQYVTYKLQRQEGENNKWEKVYEGSSNSFYDWGLTPGQTYRYRVIVGSLNIASEEITVYIDP